MQSTDTHDCRTRTIRRYLSCMFRTTAAYLFWSTSTRQRLLGHLKQSGKRNLRHRSGLPLFRMQVTRHASPRPKSCWLKLQTRLLQSIDKMCVRSPSLFGLRFVHTWCQNVCLFASFLWPWDFWIYHATAGKSQQTVLPSPGYFNCIAFCPLSIFLGRIKGRSLAWLTLESALEHFIERHPSFSADRCTRILWWIQVRVPGSLITCTGG